MTAIEDKMRENWSRWFGHVNRRPTDTPIRCDFEKQIAMKKGIEEDLRRLENQLKEILKTNGRYGVKLNAVAFYDPYN